MEKVLSGLVGIAESMKGEEKSGRLEHFGLNEYIILIPNCKQQDSWAMSG